jgi:diguanylate cyclase (GGDEF)-like protein
MVGQQVCLLMDVLSLDLSSRSAPYGDRNDSTPHAPRSRRLHGRALALRDRLLRLLDLRGDPGRPSPDGADAATSGNVLHGYTAAEILLGLGLVAFATVGVPIWPGIASDALAGTALAGPTGGVLLWTMFGLMGSVRTASAAGGSIHFTFHLPFVGAAMVLGGPTAGAWVALLSTIDRRELQSQPWYGTLANHAAIATAAVLGGLTYAVLLEGLTAATGDARMATFVAILAAGFVLEAVASGLALVTVKLRDGLSWAGILAIVMDDFRIEMLLEVALIWVLVLAFASVGWWAPVVVGIALIWYLGRGRDDGPDPLTQLMRKRTFVTRADRKVGWIRRGILAGGTMLYIDLTDFHLVNNKHGHDVGDAALRVVAERMRLVFPRHEDLLSRLMGDEFGVFLGGLASVRVAIRKAEQLLEALAQPVSTPAGSIDIAAAVGIVVVQGEGLTPPSAATLMVRAEQAMYLAKDEGRGSSAWHLWSPEDRLPFGGWDHGTAEQEPGA